MKKIVLSANSSWYLYNFRSSTIQALIKKKYDVICISPRDDYSDKLETMGAAWIDLKMDTNGTNPLKDIILFLELYKKYKFIKPHSVFHFTVKNNIYGSLAAGFLGLISFSNITGLGSVFLKEGFLPKIVKILYKISQRQASKIFVQNSEDMQYLIKNNISSSNKIVLLPGSGVNLNKFIPKPRSHQSQNKRLKFFFAGRMLYEKGLKELIDAINLVNEQNVKCELFLAGFVDVGNKSAVPIETIKAWSEKDYISWLGPSDNLEDLIAIMYVAILPSYREGMPRFLLEAGAAGLPSITTDVQGCNEIIQDGYNGLICRPKDVFSLVKNINDIIIMSNAQRQKMGLNARKVVEDGFGEEKVVQKTLSVIQGIN